MYLFCLFIIIGFLVAKSFSGKKEGEDGILNSLRFKYKSYMIHIHHWIFSLFILLVLNFLGFSNEFINGFLVGLIIHGLTYSDFYKIVYKR